MRVLIVVILFVAVTSVACYEVKATKLIDSEIEVSQTKSGGQSFMPFWKKKKKVKTSDRMKKRNRRMGKKFKRQNDDTLRR